ncbi:MAG: hypothetical protein KatS3mg008_1484 [Acidimicrobiales bacterium]|nr:MAG: hypothetical protein KatS3mg008_1484 [Acidimicrobiales bacterium]
MARRLDPAGKAALFSAPVQSPPDALTSGPMPDGREALFSSGPPRPGTVLVECSECSARVRTSLLDVGLRLVSLSLWIPFRRHPHWMRCPVCGRHTWCRIGWTE